MNEQGSPRADAADGPGRNSSEVHRLRYRRFRNHLIPRTGLGRRLASLFLGLFLLTQWPALPLVNRIEPTVLGFPFLFVYLLVVYVALIVTLVTAAYFEF